MRAVAVAALVAAFTLTGCGGKSTPAATPSAAGPATASPAAASTPAGPLAFGRSQGLTDEAGTVRATAYAYRVLRSQVPPDRKGYRYSGVDIKVCLAKTSKPNSLSWDPWSIEFADSTTIDPVSSWSDDWFTVPLYSGFGKTVRPGGCLRGWALFEVPKGKRPVKVVYSPGGAGPLEWKVS